MCTIFNWPILLAIQYSQRLGEIVRALLLQPRDTQGFARAAGMKSSISTSLNNGTCVLQNLTFGYPIKYIHVPTLHQGQLANASVYVLGYGGGFVSGDCVSAEMNVASGTCLTLLTQGSTKVFKQRFGDCINQIGPARQSTQYRVEPNAALVILPDPLVPFADSSFVQQQTIHLAKSSSLILLDWYTSGRYERGEAWKFESYASNIHIHSVDKLIINDKLKLHHFKTDYQVFAALYILGPHFSRQRQTAIDEFAKVHHGPSMKHDTQDPVLWSVSPLAHNELGIIIRACAKETQHIRQLIQRIIDGIEDVIGENLFSRIR